MGSNDCIGQKGIIEDIANGVAKVSITSVSACANCDSKSTCLSTEKKITIVEVKVNEEQFHKGDVVDVIMKKNLGLEATIIAYLIPFIIIILSLVILNKSGVKESLSGLISILLLAPYFLILYFFRQFFKKKFQFSLKKES